MAFRLVDTPVRPKDWGTLLTGMFGCYDTIGDPDFDMDRDETLHERSRYEFVRDQLTDAQRAELDHVDAFWKANREAFNRDFGRLHAFEDKRMAMSGWIEDENGEVPAIPRSHWWWWPLEDPAE